MKLKVGDNAPDFSGINQHGNQISKALYAGKNLIVFFYPKDNTPTCTEEACNLRDHYAEWKKAGYEVIGVSADTARKHINFISKHNLPYDLVADTDKKMIESFGVWGPKKFMGREFDGIIRTTFVINEKGVISHIFDKIKAKEHSAQILEAISGNNQ